MGKTKSLKTIKAKAWKLFSEYVRRKDADEGGTTRCYTCLQLAHWKELQCGHSIPGRHNAVLFDAEICRPQCQRCNIWCGGSYHMFTTRLIKENGMDWWEAKLEGSREVVKYTRSDLEDLILVLKTKIAILDNLCRGCENPTCRTSGCTGA